jgi:hypothetical protein
VALGTLSTGNHALVIDLSTFTRLQLDAELSSRGLFDRVRRNLKNTTAALKQNDAATDQSAGTCAA